MNGGRWSPVQRARTCDPQGQAGRPVFLGPPGCRPCACCSTCTGPGTGTASPCTTCHTCASKQASQQSKQAVLASDTAIWIWCIADVPAVGCALFCILDSQQCFNASLIMTCQCAAVTPVNLGVAITVVHFWVKHLQSRVKLAGTCSQALGQLADMVKGSWVEQGQTQLTSFSGCCTVGRNCRWQTLKQP